MLKKLNGSSPLIAWITVIILIISQIIIVSRWAGITDQRLAGLEDGQKRIESMMNQHLQLGSK